ncbi:MAG TPA: ATP-binding protein [Mycobacteriales bacterium]|nr:ATP-binding protein [Mycobacteriales bacterium]
MATAFLLYGRIGVGKSTYAQSLAEHGRAVVFDGDRWVGQLYGREEGAFVDFDEALGKVETVMYDVWARCLMLQVNVVLDLGFWKRAKRDRVREQVTSLGASYELHEIVADPEIAWQRVARRNTDPEAAIDISRTSFDLLQDKVEPLADDEPHITVQG